MSFHVFMDFHIHIYVCMHMHLFYTEKEIHSSIHSEKKFFKYTNWMNRLVRRKIKEEHRSYWRILFFFFLHRVGNKMFIIKKIICSLSVKFKLIQLNEWNFYFENALWQLEFTVMYFQLKKVDVHWSLWLSSQKHFSLMFLKLRKYCTFWAFQLLYCGRQVTHNSIFNLTGDYKKHLVLFNCCHSHLLH